MFEKTLYLHIGRHKTGTSSLQHFLFANRERLESLGFCYPRIGRYVNHSAVASALVGPAPRKALEMMRIRKQFEQETRPFPKVICSSEGFQNVKASGRLGFFFRRRLVGAPLWAVLSLLAGPVLLPGQRPPAYRIHTLCYLREFLDYARSAYAQRVQAAALSCGFEDYCRGFFKIDLDRFMEFWRAFSDTAQFLSYEQTLARPGGVVTDFLERLSLPLPGATEATGDKNPTISGHLLAFKLIVNRCFAHQPGHYLALRRLAEAEARFRGPFRISREQAATLRAGSTGYNDILRRTVGDFPERDFSQYPELLDPQRWPEDVERILAQPEFEGLRPHEMDIRNAFGELRQMGF